MSPRTQATLTPRERLTRGLAYSALGPLDVTRGAVGLGMHSARTGAASLHRRYREGRLAHELSAAQESIAKEFAAAQQVVAELPQTLQDARRGSWRSRRPWLIAGVAAVALAGGAAAFVIIRRSTRPEDSSPRPPSVELRSRP